MPPQDPNLAPGEIEYIPNQGEQVPDIDSSKEKSKSFFNRGNNKCSRNRIHQTMDRGAKFESCS